MKKNISAITLLGLAVLITWLGRQSAAPPAPPAHPSSGPPVSSPRRAERGGESAASAFARRARNAEIVDSGRVVRILADDNDGSRHQRLLVRTDSGPTVLIAHNIDLAPRVSPLREGDTVSFQGEYVWNEKGGVVHWTHRDPAGHHPGGWVRLGGESFQ